VNVLLAPDTAERNSVEKAFTTPPETANTPPELTVSVEMTPPENTVSVPPELTKPETAEPPDRTVSAPPLRTMLPLAHDTVPVHRLLVDTDKSRSGVRRRLEATSPRRALYAMSRLSRTSWG
jgi:hypothetical protein